MASLLKGRSSSKNANTFILPFHFFNAGMRSFIWWQWVESNSNVADFPSRFDLNSLFELIPPDRSTYLTMYLPEPPEWFAGLQYWLDMAGRTPRPPKPKPTQSTAQRNAARRVRLRTSTVGV